MVVERTELSHHHLGNAMQPANACCSTSTCGCDIHLGKTGRSRSVGFKELGWGKRPPASPYGCPSPLQLTLLPPAVMEAIVDGQQAEGMTLPGLMADSPQTW